MKLWLATTEPRLAAEAFALGVFQGVLTNPTTLAAAQRPTTEVLRDLCAATPGPVFYQLNNTTVAEMQRSAEALLDQRWSNLGIKVPITREGCAVLHWLREQKVQLRLATAVPDVPQLLLALGLDTPWVTPSGSALEKKGGPSKLSVLTAMQSVIDRSNAATVLIPSLSSPEEWRALALAGVRSGFIWDKDLAKFVESDLVREIVAGFAPAWSKLASATSHY